MADGDTGDGSYLDPRGDTPVGSTWAIGATQTNPNDPLIDWASNLNKDDMAKFLHDPQGTAADLAARGVQPPTTEQIQQMHDHNEAMGTPSRSTRFDTQPASPLDQAPAYGPYRVNPATGKLYNLTSEMNQQPLQNPVDEAGRPIPQHGSQGIEMSTFPHPGGTNPDDPGSVAKKIQGLGQPQGPQPQYHKPGENVPRAPAPPGTPAERLHYPPPGSTDPTSGGFIGPQPPGGALEPTPPPIPAVTEPKGVSPPGGGKNAQSEAEKAKKEKSLDITTPEGRQNVGESISNIGKAMQGVKAPEPLRPPQIGAPAGPHPLAANAPALASLLGLAGGGRPTPPVLRLLGRG